MSSKYLALAFDNGVTLCAPVPAGEAVVPYVKATKDLYENDTAIPPFKYAVASDEEAAITAAENKLAS